MKPILSRLALFTISIAVTLLILEILIRLVSPQPRVFLDFGDIYQPDLETGFSLRPGAVSIKGDIRINSLGFRDREYSIKKSEGSCRIMVLGDSFTFGMGPAATVFTKVLEKRLNESSGPALYEVMSVGVPGWGTDEELVWLRRSGLSLSPDVVILAFFVGNDMHDNRELGELVPFGGKLVRREFAEKHSTEVGTAIVRLRETLLSSHLFRLVFARLSLALDSARVDASKGGQPARRVFEVYQSRLPFFLGANSAPAWVNHAWHRTETLLGEMKLLLEHHQIPMLVIIIPDRFQIDEELAKELRSEMDPSTASAFDIQLPQEKLGEILKRAEIDYLDLLPDFIREGRARGGDLSLYHAMNAHWNREGNALAADLLLHYLQKRGFAPTSSGSLNAPCQISTSRSGSDDLPVHRAAVSAR